MFLIWIFDSDPLTAKTLQRICYRSAASFAPKLRITVFTSVLRSLSDKAVFPIPDLILGDPFSDPALERLMRLYRYEHGCDLILLTLDTSCAAFYRALRLSPDDYLIKPVSKERLRRSLDAYFHRRRMLPAFAALTQEDVDRFLYSFPSSKKNAYDKKAYETENASDASFHKDLLLRILPLFSEEKSQLNATEVSELLSVSRVSAGRYLRQLCDRGWLTKQTVLSGKKGRPTIVYEIRRSGKEFPSKIS